MHLNATRLLGMSVLEQDPVCQTLNPQGNTERVSEITSTLTFRDVIGLTTALQQLNTLGSAVAEKHRGMGPQLILVVLPDNATDLYRAIKQKC